MGLTATFRAQGQRVPTAVSHGHQVSRGTFLLLRRELGPSAVSPQLTVEVHFPACGSACWNFRVSGATAVACATRCSGCTSAPGSPAPQVYENAVCKGWTATVGTGQRAHVLAAALHLSEAMSSASRSNPAWGPLRWDLGVGLLGRDSQKQPGRFQSGRPFPLPHQHTRCPTVPCCPVPFHDGRLGGEKWPFTAPPSACLSSVLGCSGHFLNGDAEINGRTVPVIKCN